MKPTDEPNALLAPTPVRIRLRWSKGFNLQATSRAINSLTAVNCARPGKWGNPYYVGHHGTAAECVAKYRKHVLGEVNLNTSMFELRGKNLACWCRLGAPCHADLLLELAAREPPK
jgi:hypothetical protein